MTSKQQLGAVDAVAPTLTASPSAIITVVRDPSNYLGKQFSINPAGTIDKKSSVSLSLGIAIQHHVPTHEDLVNLLDQVGDDPHAAIINARFKDIAVGEEFIILSGREIEERFSIPCADRERQNGVHHLEYRGNPYKAVGRFKENVEPSNWQLLDRDVDSHTPQQFSDLSIEDWLGKLATIIPGVDQVNYVFVPSASSRVARGGQTVGGGNGHVWVYVQNPSDMERVRSAVLPLAWHQDMAWNKPRHSKKDASEIVGQGQATLVDQSVWTPGRLVFDGQPVVGDGLSVVQLSAQITLRANVALDTSAVVLLDHKELLSSSRKAGVSFERRSDGSIRITANDLQLSTEIETQRQGLTTVRELLVAGMADKLRCQAPFRDSESWAAFIGVNQDGIPFVFDHGTGTTHWLTEFEQDDAKLIKAGAVIDAALPDVVADSATVLDDGVVSSLASIKQVKPAEYQRKRAALKQANPKVSLAALDSAVKSWESTKVEAQTHHGYAKALLSELTEAAWKPVGYHGTLFVLDADTRLWTSLPTDKLVSNVAEMHDGKDHCSRGSDYKVIADHAISLVTDEKYFKDAPIGVACPGGFYQIVDGSVSLVHLVPEHRQRVMLSITPAQQATPMFDAFLHETFASENVGEEAQQIALVQQVAGAIMLGLMPQFQKAVLFYEPFGRAGKGTLERFLRNLVPPEYVTAISPFKWAQDYHVATLAGARFNVVGELPDGEAIPGSSFKTVIGGDLITGRHPTHRPITFTNEAAHLFMSNHLITTKDQGEAFYSRWLIVGFPNSRLRSGLPLDPGLADRIIANEMPGIAYWALEGARRLLADGAFSKSTTHDRLMAQWRRSTSSLDEFIYERCALGADLTSRRSDLYVAYTKWCSESGRKPFAKGRVKDLLEHNVGMGVRLVELNGHETFRGLSVKPETESKNDRLDELLKTF